MTALEKLRSKNKELKYICVGLDTDINKIPKHLKNYENPVLEFNKAIINETCNYAAAYKINFAFYEKLGQAGFEIIKQTISLIPQDILIIGDAKRGDIGNTSKMYAEALFDFFNLDAITVNPYLGEDSVIPFLERDDKIVFLLALTSNPGAGDFEKLKLNDGRFLFQKVIEKVKVWNKKDNCGIVFGATKIEELKENIISFGNLPVLLPGVGSQGGSLENVVETFKENNRQDFIINVSRAIIYKSNDKDFAKTAQNEIINLNNSVRAILI
ncbi:MAG: orotidine-5'-phosphate decarboxylase [Ignavibacteriaceae bacterium]